MNLSIIFRRLIEKYDQVKMSSEIRSTDPLSSTGVLFLKLRSYEVDGFGLKLLLRQNAIQIGSSGTK